MPGKIKSKVVRATLDNSDVIDMFHSVLGGGEGGDLSLAVIHPKFLRMERHCGRFLTLLAALLAEPLMDRFPDEAAALAAYSAALKAQAAAVFDAPDLAALHPPDAEAQLAGRAAAYAAVTEAERDAFAAAYLAAKDCNIVNTIVVTCKNLIPHRKSLENASALQGRFMTHSAGLTFAPLPGLAVLNFKRLYTGAATTDADRAFLLMVLHKMLEISHDVYEAVTSPDIDVDEFVGVIVSSLDDVKAHIPRCDEAFDKIRDSVGLLKGNFGGYYQDYVASNNPTIIMENFVLDVSKSSGGSPKIAGQFRRIIGHYRRLAGQQAQDPRMRSLFAQVDKNFEALDRAGGGGEDEGAADPEEGASAAAPADEAADAEAAAAVTAAAAAAAAAAAGARRRAEARMAAALAGAAGGDDGGGLGEELDRLAE